MNSRRNLQFPNETTDKMECENDVKLTQKGEPQTHFHVK